MPSSARTPLKSKALVEFVTKPAGSRTSVIIEARRPAVASSVVSATKRIGVSAVPKAHKPVRKTQLAATAAPQMRAVEAVLKNMGLGAAARRLDSAGAFVVEVSPSQLQQLSEAPSVQAIRPNRFNRRVSP